eukprot:jgi/Chrpa1/26736/Chrysochromulina_OHIO_Genome00025680-RA
MYFNVSAGLCTVDPAAPNCIRSPNFPAAYAISQTCTITSTSLAIGSSMTSTNFSTQAGYDKLSLPNTAGTLVPFSGLGSSFGLSNFVLGAGWITWFSDGLTVSTGWRVCSNPPSPPPSAQYFTVSTGLCTVDPYAPNCIISPNFPFNYFTGTSSTINPSCTITPNSLAIGSSMAATSFSTDLNDRLWLPNAAGALASFSGTLLTSGPSAFTLGAGNITWYSDTVTVSTGWRVCSNPQPPPAPPRAPPPSPLAPLPPMSPQLDPGGCAVVYYKAVDPDEIGIVLFDHLFPGDTIYITDNSVVGGLQIVSVAPTAPIAAPAL